MGVLHANRLIEYFRRGLYNQKPSSYIVSVDGEFIRYKGMIGANMTQHNAEEAVANTSFEYLVRTIMWIETYMSKRACEVIVYMDGTRVANKTRVRPESELDMSLIRTVFKTLCVGHGYRLHALDHGESELQMYLQRDRTVDLNILLTRDSDMLSICYGHLPKYFCTKTGTELSYGDIENRGLIVSNLQWADETAMTIESSGSAMETEDIHDDITFGVFQKQTASTYLSTACNRITDINSTYTRLIDNNVKVCDSCMWIVCGSSSKPMQAIGFDACSHRIGYSDLAFRTFIAMCGTDFTESIITPSMFTGFFSAAGDDEKRYINILKDVCKIVASIIYMGLKGGGEIKRGLTSNSKYNGRHDRFSQSDLKIIISMYYEYITTGVMTNKQIPKINSVLTVKHFVYAMRGGKSNRFVKREMIKWANNVPLHECLTNIDKYLGSYVCSKLKAPVNDKNNTNTTTSKDPFIHFLANANDVQSAIESDKLSSQTITRQLQNKTTVEKSLPKKPAIAIAFSDSSDDENEKRLTGRMSEQPSSFREDVIMTQPQVVFELDDY